MPCSNLAFKVRRVLQQYTRYHLGVFMLTFCSYAFLHATRKTFSNVKTTIAAEWTPSPLNGSASECRTPYYGSYSANASSAECRTPYDVWDKRHLFINPRGGAEEFMGTLDACFMFAYGVGLFVSGFVADRNDLRLVLSIGMGLTSVTVFVFGCVFQWTQFYSKPAYVAIWLLNGFLQSAGWPSVVAVMGNWFGKGSRGLVMGVWSACASVGNIIGALLVATVLDYGYDYAFLLTASVLLAGALFNFFGLVPSPLDVGLPMPEDGSAKSRAGSSSVQSKPLLENAADDDDDDDDYRGSPKSEPVIYCIQDTRPKAINFLTALILPGVIPYALCYAFLKLVNYSFFFWLPFYLSNAHNMNEAVADKLSIWYDIGGIVGGSIAGFISDRLEKRAIVIMPMLLAAIPMLFLYGLTDLAATMLNNGILLFILGMLIGGVSNLISSAISADLGRQKALKGNAEALSTVTGIIDGTGSLGAAVGQVAVPHMQVQFGWRVVFYLFMASTSLTAVCIAHISYHEIKEVFLRRRWMKWLCGTHESEALRVLEVESVDE